MFKRLELHTGSRFLVTHVSGERMKAQGTDGLSRGQLREGVSLGLAMNAFCPWGNSALQRSPDLKLWLQSWIGSDLEVLTPSQWFTRGHDHFSGNYDCRGFWRLTTKPGRYLWDPPLAAADAMMEEVRKAALKRTQSTHFILLPRLFTPLWLKQVYKACDAVLTIPCTHSFWSKTQYEPLFLGIIFPHLTVHPYRLKGTFKMLSMERQVCKLLQDANLDTRNILYKFLSETRNFSSMSEGVLRKVLYYGRKD